MGVAKIALRLADIFSSQTSDQNVSINTMTGFNFEELFAEDAEPIPTYLMNGMSQKVKLNLWDGFHKTVLGEAKKCLDNMEEAQKFRVLMPLANLLPLFITSVTGKIAVDVKPEDVESIMGLPQAAMA